MKDRDELAAAPIRPVAKGAPALAPAEAQSLLAVLGAGWQIVDARRLRKDYKFPDFTTALAFVNQVGNLADQVDHHPDIELSWGKAAIEIWTHTVGGLHTIDFVFAARCEHLLLGDSHPAEP